MTESFRRSGAYESPRGDGTQGTTMAPQPTYPQQQHSASAVDPEWPPPPAYGPAEPFSGEPFTAEPLAAEQGAAPWPGRPAQAPPSAHPAQGMQPAYAAGTGQDTTAGHGGDGTAVFPAPPAADGAPKKRTRGPIALLAAVAIVAAAVGGGTAYAFQELTGKSTVATSSTSTSVVPSSKKGSISAIAAAVSPSVVEVTATLSNGTSTGAGVIITSGGEIVTNNHVISGASSIKVKTSDGKSYTAEVVGTDSKKDLALIKAQSASGLKAASLGDSSGVQVGDEVVAIGSPEGLTGTVTSGIVSALNRDVTVSTDENQGQNQGGDGNWPFQFGGRQFNGDTGSSTTTYKALQTDASLNPGNSGGALIDMNGNIVGINSAMYSSGSSSSSSSDAGSVGLGFAIPINTVKSDLATLRSGSTN
ncbi:trypsin-like peptidase domain-containing protein [Streptomyces sp. NPDC047000]|uniref:S1C family serine protease n=1 Tax=Streptomyces sp. NPDC047000 TaxID=3155474 RepID=UPI0033EC4FFA